MTGDRGDGAVRNRTALGGTPARAVALDCLEAGIGAARPDHVIADRVALDGGALRLAGESYDLDDCGTVLVLGGGPGTGRAAAALSDRLGERLDGGAVISDDPMPDGRAGSVEVLPPGDGTVAARRVLDGARAAGEGDLVLAVLGGGPSTLAVPAGDLALEDLRNVTAALRSTDATPEEVAAVRTHCSVLAGGGLARAAAPASVVGFVFGAAAGDGPGSVAGGPTVPDGTTYGEAMGVLDGNDVTAPAVRAHLAAGIDGEFAETPAPGDPVFDGVDTHVLSDAWTAIEAARRAARERGYAATVLSATVTGPARESVLEHLAAAESVRRHGTPVAAPAVVLSGGDTTVGAGPERDGRSGPNQAFALGAALGLTLSGEDSPVSLDSATVAAVDTGGRDGDTDAAGGVVDADTVDDPDAAREALTAGDGYDYLDARDALVVTGHTGATVGDLRVVVVEDG